MFRCVLLPSTLSAVKLRSLWVRQPSPKVALTLLTIKSTSCVLPFRRIFLLRVKRAYRWFCSIRAKPVIQQQRTAKQYIGLSDTARRVSKGMRFVTFVKSNAKALLTLRIKSPLRSAEGTTRNLLVNPVLVFAQTFTNTAYCARPQHAFCVDNILTRSDIFLCNEH